MDALLTSCALVALAEMGDKTQLLAMLLATRFRKPVPIILGILVATLANHFLAALVGHSIAGVLTQPWFRYAVAASFIAMAAWTLIPDKIDEDAPLKAPSKAGVFLTTLVAFFLVEMGDKTRGGAFMCSYIMVESCVCCFWHPVKLIFFRCLYIYHKMLL